jgi:hypothetical protein
MVASGSVRQTFFELAGHLGLPQALPSIGRIARPVGVRLGNGIDMAPSQAFPGNVGPDPRGIDMDDLALRAMPAAMQAFKVRSKMRRNRSAPQRCRIRVSEE